MLQLERRFVGEDAVVTQVQTGLRGLEAPAQRLGSTHPDVVAGLGSLYADTVSTLRQLSGEAQAQGSAHPDVIAALARLYADTVSTLRPRVMVQGNPHYLGQAGVVAEIRALLLAALRSAVLWRQCGGSLWDFVFRRREMAAAIDARLR